MHYIVLDFEWNQPLTANDIIDTPFVFDSEIIEIGAVKLDDGFQTVDTFKAFVTPKFYPILNGAVSKLTHISASTLKTAETFPEAYARFIDWCGEEYAFMVWGTTDLPVLMDNMLMHGLSLKSIPDCYDLQRIFGREVLRNDGQCSLENAMKMLKLPMERAHDALNDVKNTVKIADFMDLNGCMDDYFTAFVGYKEERLSDLFGKKVYASLDAGLADEEVLTFTCPHCNARVKGGNFKVLRSGRVAAFATCDEGDDFLMRFSTNKCPDGGVVVRRKIFEMNNDLYNQYCDGEEKTINN